MFLWFFKWLLTSGNDSFFLVTKKSPKSWHQRIRPRKVLLRFYRLVKHHYKPPGSAELHWNQWGVPVQHEVEHDHIIQMKNTISLIISK